MRTQTWKVEVGLCDVRSSWIVVLNLHLSLEPHNFEGLYSRLCTSSPG